MMVRFPPGPYVYIVLDLERGWIDQGQEDAVQYYQNIVG